MTNKTIESDLNSDSLIFFERYGCKIVSVEDQDVKDSLAISYFADCILRWKLTPRSNRLIIYYDPVPNHAHDYLLNSYNPVAKLLNLKISHSIVNFPKEITVRIDE